MPKHPPSPPVTANDVARLAGVSRSAVSRTFTPGASVAAKTRARVEAAAAQLGYRPNLIARSLITRRSGIVGLAVGYMTNQFYPALVEALSQRLAALGKRLLLFPVMTNGNSDPQVEEILRYQVDALMLASATLSSGLASQCRALGVPVILINRVTQDKNCDSVTGDNDAGGYAIGSFIAASGYQRPAFMAGLEDSSTSQEREAGYRRALAEAGLTLHARVTGHYDFDVARAAMRDLLSMRVRPDVVFCANDHMAVAAHMVATQEFGLTVGRDVAIVGFDDVAMAGWPCFSLTTYSQPVDAMADGAVGLIDRRAADPATPPMHLRIPGALIGRNSAPVRRAVASGALNQPEEPAERRPQ